MRVAPFSQRRVIAQVCRKMREIFIEQQVLANLEMPPIQRILTNFLACLLPLVDFSVFAPCARLCNSLGLVDQIYRCYLVERVAFSGDVRIGFYQLGIVDVESLTRVKEFKHLPVTLTYDLDLIAEGIAWKRECTHGMALYQLAVYNWDLVDAIMAIQELEV